MSDYLFDHEKLHVYQKALLFIVWLNETITGIEKRHAVVDQLDRASTSIVLNIAEGNGKFTARDRCKYFDIARGSALECAGGLDTIAAKKCYQKKSFYPGK
jgi:four helix bundle protein